MKQRPIKFRVWGKFRKNDPDRMHYDTYGDMLIPANGDRPIANNNFGDGYYGACGDRDYFMDGYVIMQYTGAKDKNNEEIYDGDVIKCEELVMEVRWDEFECAVVPVSDRGSVVGWGIAKHSLIIGNIYESSELLKP
jgi:uncharacterized phage protein (TIGR01671 family)